MGAEREVREFIVTNFLFGDESHAPAKEDSLLERGIIDSTGVLELVGFLESTYNIKITDQELVPANLDSVGNLVRFIDRKTIDSARDRSAG